MILLHLCRSLPMPLSGMRNKAERFGSVVFMLRLIPSDLKKGLLLLEKSPDIASFLLPQNMLIRFNEL